MTALTRLQLDIAGCGTPNCGHDHSVLFLHAACHPSAGTRVSYDKPTGLLTVACKRCDKLVVQVKVADE
jgi:hypothetical protein